jgi:16S rRNA (cytosine967-C5)-methyltransferase
VNDPRRRPRDEQDPASARRGPPGRRDRSPRGGERKPARGARKKIGPARTAAYRALVDAERRHGFADRRLRELFEETTLPRADRALATRLVQETLRRRGELDFRLARMMERAVSSVPVPVMEALRIGLLQLLYLDRVPAHAAVNDSVNLVHNAGYPEFAGLANAVLRRAARGDVPPLPEGDDDEALAARYSFPVWLVRRWRRLDQHLLAALEGSNRTPDLVLRVNRLRSGPERVLDHLSADGVDAEAGRIASDCVRVTGRLDLESMEDFRAGHVTVQDESEALVVELVDPLPSHRVLDMCAAPGGKSTHILERGLGLLELVSMDVSQDRLERVRESLDRLSLGAHEVVGDGGAAPVRPLFDRVLVDAPCTGTGVLARRADARWRLEPDDPARCAVQQFEILCEAAKLVVVGGLLVYSVCSIETEETTEITDQFLQSHPGFRQEPVHTLPAAARDAEGRLRLLPGQFGSDGVYGVRFRRTQ